MYEPGQIPQGDEPASLSHGDYKGRSPLEHEVQEVCENLPAAGRVGQNKNKFPDKKRLEE